MATLVTMARPAPLSSLVPKWASWMSWQALPLPATLSTRPCPPAVVAAGDLRAPTPMAARVEAARPLALAAAAAGDLRAPTPMAAPVEAARPSSVLAAVAAGDLRAPTPMAATAEAARPLPTIVPAGFRDVRARHVPTRLILLQPWTVGAAAVALAVMAAQAAPAGMVALAALVAAEVMAEAVAPFPAVAAFGVAQESVVRTPVILLPPRIVVVLLRLGAPVEATLVDVITQVPPCAVHPPAPRRLDAHRTKRSPVLVDAISRFRPAQTGESAPRLASSANVRAAGAPVADVRAALALRVKNVWPKRTR